MRTKFFLIVGVAVLVALGVLWFGTGEVEAPVTDDETVQATFTSTEAGVSIEVFFNQTDDTARMTGIGYEDIVLVRAVSASGARYVHEELNLELWNKGDEITVSREGEMMFVGTTTSLEEHMETESTSVDVIPLLTSEALTAHTWVWKETRMNNDEVIVPKEAGAFSITFSLDGNIQGTTDCNGFGGSYALSEEGTLSYGSFMSTLMFCEGSQETEFTRMITDATRGFVTATGELVLELPYDSGSVIFTPE